jgi:hypothetical protein
LLSLKFQKLSWKQKTGWCLILKDQFLEMANLFLTSPLLYSWGRAVGAVGYRNRSLAWENAGAEPLAPAFLGRSLKGKQNRRCYSFSTCLITDIPSWCKPFQIKNYNVFI